PEARRCVPRSGPGLAGFRPVDPSADRGGARVAARRPLLASGDHRLGLDHAARPRAQRLGARPSASVGVGRGGSLPGRLAARSLVARSAHASLAPRRRACLALARPAARRRRRRRRAVTGCAAVAGLTLLPALLLYPGSVSAFVHAERAESRRQELRGDNGSLVMSAYKHSGWLAVAGAVLLVAAIGVLAARSRRGTAGDADLHARWLWLSVALIPLAWIYSLLPLAPVIARGLLSRRLPSAMAAGIAFALPVIGMPYGYRSAPYIALTIAFAGLSVLLASRPTLVGARPSTVTSQRADAAGRVP